MVDSFWQIVGMVTLYFAIGGALIGLATSSGNYEFDIQNQWMSILFIVILWPFSVGMLLMFWIPAFFKALKQRKESPK